MAGKILKKTAAWALALCLLITPAAAEESVVLEENFLQVRLVQAENKAEEVRLLLVFENIADAERNLIILAPKVNDNPSSFGNGWGSTEIHLAKGETLETEIILCPDYPEEAIESVSFRFLCENVISSPFTLTFSSDDCQLTAASFAEANREPLLMEETVNGTVSDRSCILLTDQLSPREAETFDSGKAVLCVHVQEEGEDFYMPFCSVPVSVDASGGVQAIYSGKAITFSSAPTFPLYTEENVRKDALSWSVSGMVLSGEPIFFAELSFRLEADNDTPTLISMIVNSPELGEECVNCPLDLFSEAVLYHSFFTFIEEKGKVESQECTGHSIILPLDQSLKVMLQPATEIGEICVYFEYNYSDGHRTLRMPKSVA